MYNLFPTSKFKKDLARVIKRGYNTALMDEVVGLLVAGKPENPDSFSAFLQLITP